MVLKNKRRVFYTRRHLKHHSIFVNDVRIVENAPAPFAERGVNRARVVFYHFNTYVIHVEPTGFEPVFQPCEGCVLAPVRRPQSPGHVSGFRIPFIRARS